MNDQPTAEDKRHSIVAVDDDITILKSLQKRLSKWYDVTIFQSPTELLLSLDTIRPNLFIIDWMMEDVDGIQLCLEIRKRQRFALVPISLYTAIDPTLENIQTAYDAGAQAFISKVQKRAFLVTQVRALIDSYERMALYLRQRSMVLSALRHELLNKLTGVTSGVEALTLHKAFRKGDLARQAQTVMEASECIRDLIGDLSEMLGVEYLDSKKAILRENVSEVFEDLEDYLKDVPREMEYNGADSLEVFCDRRSLGRTLNAAVQLIHWVALPQIPIAVTSRSNGDGVYFETAAQGSYKDKLEEMVIDAEENPDSESGPGILYVQYAQNVLDYHGSALKIAEEDGYTKLQFTIPNTPKEVAAAN